MNHIIAQTQEESRNILFEHELLGALRARGCEVPFFHFVSLSQLDNPQIPDCCLNQRGVLKIVSPKILHKSDLGCVAFLPEVTNASVKSEALKMIEKLTPELRESVRGFVIEKAVKFNGSLGNELFIGLRCTPDFGPVFTFGFGGTYVEALAAQTKRDQSTIIASPTLTPEKRFLERLENSLFFRWMTGQIRGVSALYSPDELRKELLMWRDAMMSIREDCLACGFDLSEFELNPLVFNQETKHFTPVDALAKLAPKAVTRNPVSIENLRTGLSPKSVAIVGVSQRMNVGRIILQTMLAAEFDTKHLYPIRPDGAEIDGVVCTKSLAEVPEEIDLLVVAIGAPQVPALLKEAFSTATVKSVLLIPGGMGESESGKGIASEIQSIIAQMPSESRPVLIGNNSLGLASKAAHFDSIFIPVTKYPRPKNAIGGFAFVGQSGAFMLTQTSKFDGLWPDYEVSIGNQIDAQISDILEALATDESIRTFALYIEGLQPNNGPELCGIIRKLRAQGKNVVIYKGGRDGLGAQATAGHTASVAGDYRIFQDMLQDQGALLADTLDEFQDLIRVSVCLAQKTIKNGGVALQSSAGYEVVCIADNITKSQKALRPAVFSAETIEKIKTRLKADKLDSLVAAKNPLDLTPMANDAVHADCAEIILSDQDVAAAVLANVPFSAQVSSLGHGIDPNDVFDAPHGFARRYIDLFKRCEKPFVAVIDAGAHFDEICTFMQKAGIPVFRSGDRAMNALGRYVQNHL